jgi:hypothetical protein
MEPEPPKDPAIEPEKAPAPEAAPTAPPTSPAPRPSATPPPGPAAAVSVDEPVGEKERARVRWAAIFGTLGCLAIVVAWFLPWIYVPEDKVDGVRRALAPGIKALPREGEDAGHAARWTVVDEAIEEGHFTGLDLFHWFRSAWALNRRYTGPDPLASTAGTWVRQRSFLLGAVVFALLPAVAFLMACYFLTHGFRRAASPMLILMTLVGCGAGMLTIAGMRLADMKTLPLPTGIGLQGTAAASVVLGLSGIFGVTARNWWRVYAGAAVTLVAVAVLAWAYVSGGAMP